MTERIYIQVDDSELTALTSKLDTSMKRMKKIDRDTFALDTRTKSIIKRLPGLREADMLWREIQAMGTLPPGPGGVLALGTTLFMLSLALKMIERRIKQIETDIIRSRAGLEDMIREGMDLTHEEYLALGAEVVGYATPFDEFMAKWDAGEYMDAIADYVIALIPSRIPTYAGRLPYDPATIPPEVEEHWLYQLDQMLTDWWKNLWRDRGKSNEDTDYEYNMDISGAGVR